MPRIARIDVGGYPYHVIQRGNRSQKVFIRKGDQEKYIEILKTQAMLYGVEVWAYCLMSNHIHLIVFPKTDGSLTELISETHRQYTRMINFREKWRGHLWQGRFKNFPLDRNYLFAAVRYVERNPVRAGIVIEAEDYKWSSAKVHMNKGLGLDSILSYFYLMEEIGDWRAYLKQEDEQSKVEEIRLHENTGRPLGEVEFVEGLERKTGRVLRKAKPGPKIKVVVGVP